MEPNQGNSSTVTEHLTGRVSAVERSLDVLREANAQNQASLSSLRTESAAHTRDLHDIKEAITSQQKSNKTDWQVVGVWMSVVIIIATLAFAPVYRDLGKLETRAVESEEYERELAYSQGQRDEAINELKRRLDK